MKLTLLSNDSAVKRHVLADDSAQLPSVSMSASIPGTESTLGQRIAFAIKLVPGRTETRVESDLMFKHPEQWRSRGWLSSYIRGRRGKAQIDPIAMTLIADHLNVAFEWLVVGRGQLQRQPPPLGTSIEEVVRQAKAKLDELVAAASPDTEKKRAIRNEKEKLESAKKSKEPPAGVRKQRRSS